MRDIAEKLRIVRRYTGDRFSVAKGYDARKPLSKSRARTIAKYYEMIRELTDRPHKIIVPKRGEKKEMFSFTGQHKHPRFAKAIVILPDAASPYTYAIDKTRPKGSRFILINKRTKERSWHIPAHVFLDENEQLFEPDEDLDPAFFEDVLNEYAERGPNNVYMIEAGDYHMWGSAGDIPTVSKKLVELFHHYSSDIFDDTDKSSHWIGNWFRGVQVFRQGEAIAYQTERAENRATQISEAARKAGGKEVWRFGRNFRLLKSGDIGEFQFGKLVNVISVHAAKGLKTRDSKKPARRYRPKRR